MDDIIVIDDFLNEEELAMVGSLSTYTDEKWNIHGSAPLGKEVFPDFQTSFLKKDLMLYAVETFFRFNFLLDISITGFFVTIKTFIVHIPQRKFYDPLYRDVIEKKLF